jgi:hypothetical protein
MRETSTSRRPFGKSPIAAAASSGSRSPRSTGWNQALPPATDVDSRRLRRLAERASLAARFRTTRKSQATTFSGTTVCLANSTNASCTTSAGARVHWAANSSSAAACASSNSASRSGVTLIRTRHLRYGPKLKTPPNAQFFSDPGRFRENSQIYSTAEPRLPSNNSCRPPVSERCSTGRRQSNRRARDAMIGGRGSRRPA